MPVTKKKGAIFAIYSDSPQQSTITCSASTSLITRSPTKRLHASSSTSNVLGASSDISGHRSKIASGAGAGLSSSTCLLSNGTSHRKALSSIQPRSLRSSDSNITNSELSKTFTHGSKKLTPFSDSANPTEPKRRPFSPLRSTKTSRPTSTSDTRAQPRTPKRALERSPLPQPSREDKENQRPPTSGREIAPIPSDSPASRTRSKTRSDSISSSINTIAVGCLNTTGAGDMVGDGRGALSLKKGRAVAALLAAQDEDENENVFGSSKGSIVNRSTKEIMTMSTATTTQATKRASGIDLPSKTKSTGKGKGKRNVPGDQPLADVSEAYGATGQEPEGFRNVY